MYLYLQAGEDPAVALALHLQHKEKKHKEEYSVDYSETADEMLERSSPLASEIMTSNNDLEKNSQIVDETSYENGNNADTDSVVVTDAIELTVRNRKKEKISSHVLLEYQIESKDKEKEALEKKVEKYKSWKRMLLLIVAITVHNIPGMGL